MQIDILIAIGAAIGALAYAAILGVSQLRVRRRDRRPAASVGPSPESAPSAPYLAGPARPEPGSRFSGRRPDSYLVEPPRPEPGSRFSGRRPESYHAEQPRPEPGSRFSGRRPESYHAEQPRPDTPGALRYHSEEDLTPRVRLYRDAAIVVVVIGLAVVVASAWPSSPADRGGVAAATSVAATPTVSAPTAVIDTSASCADPGAAVTFDGSRSSGATGFAWDFDDGTGATTRTVAHSFAVGRYTVTLTVVGPGGQDSAAVEIGVPCA